MFAAVMTAPLAAALKRPTGFPCDVAAYIRRKRLELGIESDRTKLVAAQRWLRQAISKENRYNFTKMFQ